MRGSRDSRSGYFQSPNLNKRRSEEAVFWAVKEGSSPLKRPKLNNRGGPASDESIEGEEVKTGCVDTIVNDVNVFLNKYENGESHRWN
jgi:hypothetical protein